MKIEVTAVLLNDDVPGADRAPYKVRVTFWNEHQEFHDAGEVEVFIDGDDVPLSQIRQRAIEKARQFLVDALAAIDRR